MFKMSDISRIFKLFGDEIQLNLFRKLVDIKIFQIRNIMPKDGSHIGHSLFSSVCSDSCFVEILTRSVSNIISV